MSPVWTTFLTSLVSTILVPYLEKRYGLKLPTMEQTTLTAGAVGATTATAHWLHNAIFPHRRHR